MSETAMRVDGPSVADHRPVPTGVLPRGIQTWVMLGVAVGMIAIILFAGRREPPARTVAMTQPAAPNPERVRDYQERLRALDARAADEARSAAAPGCARVRTERRTKGRRSPARPIRSLPTASDGSTKACSLATSC